MAVAFGMALPEVDPRVAAAVSGDRAAAESLLRELLPRVRNLVRYLVRGDPEADDLAQQALVAILRGLPSYRGDGELKSWADRITVRETLARVKRVRAERARYQATPPDLSLVPGGEVAPDTYLIRRETVRLLDALPEEQRGAIVLHHVVGLSVPELAAELGVPVETARSRLRLGMQKLRQSVEGAEEG